MRQKNQVELNFGTGATGEAPRAAAEETEARALARVKANKGAAGIDGMTFEDLAPYLKEHWPAIRAQLLDGTYEPQPVRRVEIPKASGGMRPLGIPTVLDRFIQQAMMQVLQASAFGRGVRRIRRWRRRRRTSLTAMTLWWTLIWRSSSIGSITTS